MVVCGKQHEWPGQWAGEPHKCFASRFLRHAPCGQMLPRGRLCADAEPSAMLEVAKPIAVALCMLSLCAVFNAAFLVPAMDVEHRSWEIVILVSLAVGVCLASGMLF